MLIQKFFVFQISFTYFFKIFLVADEGEIPERGLGQK